jgi:hypothetical protein
LLQVLAQFSRGQIGKASSKSLTPDYLVVARVKHRDPKAKRQTCDNLSCNSVLSALADAFLDLVYCSNLSLVSDQKKSLILPPLRAKFANKDNIYAVSKSNFNGLDGQMECFAKLCIPLVECQCPLWIMPRSKQVSAKSCLR